MVWLPDGKKILNICVFVSTEYINMMDRQTDRHRMTAQAVLMHSIARQKHYASTGRGIKILVIKYKSSLS